MEDHYTDNEDQITDEPADDFSNGRDEPAELR
jgi:hypothetical protein